MPVVNKLEENSSVFSGEEKRILLISPFVMNNSPKFS